MGLLVDGVWKTDWYDTASHDGRFKRDASSFRNSIDPAGLFPPETGRYHLYVSLACPWAHRTLIYRVLKGLTEAISVSVVNWLMEDHGWTFEPGEGTIPDTLYGADYLHQIYTRAKPDYSGRVTVPVLWDKQRETIVNNESAEIIRFFDDAFDSVAKHQVHFYPPDYRDDIDALNARIYDTVNNGVYKAGFATTQHAYEEAVYPLFATLDWLEDRLSRQNFLCGNRVTEADWRLFTTLIRFDSVYVGHFKCNIRRLSDYPELLDYMRALYQVPGIADTVNFTHIKRHYYMSHRTINPAGIVPVGPELQLTVPARRDAAGAIRP
ncbi:glutathione S-transferase family protein [Granulibacter bethesdensis]|uniref:glutathione S-transferase family protein n=1 Tax=Granulibacter bethesdensis TaxID=364410 RepID=UPI000909A0A0|nr:glutathione S-transferase family protein [Granulibacter bethesdensis]APH60220.1 Glutathione S-transferase family protein [Granulibacter bethesdensis]